MGKTEDRSGRPGGNSPDGPPEVLWNEEEAACFQAHAAHVSYTREELELRFGDGRRNDTSNELVLEPKAQILLSPVLAKRLALRLQNHIQDYERRYGPLDPGPPQQADTPSHKLIGKTSSKVELEDLPEEARSLVRQVQDLGVLCGLERSFKFMDRVLLTRRLLLGFRRDDLPPDGASRLVDICQGAGMPEDHLAAFQERLPEAAIVLFGFEQEGGSDTFRAYLEFGQRFRNKRSINSDPPEPFMVHLGYKWDPGNETRKTTTRYTCFPGLSKESMLERIPAVYGDRDSSNPLAIAAGILERAAKKGPEDALLYFEAEEEPNPRTSFDLNLYAANLQMADLTPFLSDLCTLYHIPYPHFDTHYTRVQNLIFGHLTGGLDRNGRDFMTVYFGEKGTTWL